MHLTINELITAIYKTPSLSIGYTEIDQCDVDYGVTTILLTFTTRVCNAFVAVPKDSQRDKSKDPNQASGSRK